MREPTQMPPPLPSVIVDLPEPATAGGRGPAWEAAGTRAWVLMLDMIPAAKVTQSLDGKHHVAWVHNRDTWPTSGYDSLHNAQVEAVHQVLAGRKAKLLQVQNEIVALDKLLRG